MGYFDRVGQSACASHLLPCLVMPFVSFEVWLSSSPLLASEPFSHPIFNIFFLLSPSFFSSFFPSFLLSLLPRTFQSIHHSHIRTFYIHFHLPSLFDVITSSPTKQPRQAFVTIKESTHTHTLLFS
ncbi:MAG: hypothetical protein JOS17DRAFT_136048 [Linnemannia elongata]|nr:MAG: hypothetical protein JOS17DRAFT_136048 [Linnemannia elongata]